LPAGQQQVNPEVQLPGEYSPTHAFRSSEVTCVFVDVVVLLVVVFDCAKHEEIAVNNNKKDNKHVQPLFRFVILELPSLINRAIDNFN
jgi:hypothetical protein